MPEGHKTHYLSHQHDQTFAGQSLDVTSPQGRFADGARKVNGRVLESVRAAGKHLFFEFEGNRVVHVHLGRYGSFAEQASPPEEPRGQVRVRMVGKERTLDLRGPTQCRVIDMETQASIEESLGPDPLAGGKKADVWNNFRSRSKPIGGLLLDQSLIAGVGNIFRAEVLFEIGMNPHLHGDAMSQADFDRLWKSLSKMMKLGLKHGRIISVTAKEAGKPLKELANHERFRVYGKDECPRCGGPIAIDSVASRKMHWCPSCQA
ncbi:Fpg/Nei family DNA glycosylase [Rhodopirellula halodulae]|uniref:Fpg/Nei family DNA glycosylase n=1 Tax=Rhodopirellula halodulae TaxID=2894198 RepID=UPI001E33E8A7|nr:DNA glycosylase [Rhodopirellula sp. JC737]MCC9655820.1 Fpg/Nei family DNA glycosylase [Rhodopirellula sp. JC737]